MHWEAALNQAVAASYPRHSGASVQGEETGAVVLALVEVLN